MQGLFEDALASRYFSDGGPFQGTFSPGASDSRVVVLTGPNASGKSLLIRLLASWLNDDKVEPIQVSMKYRTEGGIHRAFMFGSDADQSTGATSVYAVQGALNTSNNREKPHWVMLDEPDIGLAEEYAEAMGTYVASYGNAVPAMSRGLVLVSHSRALVRGLVANLAVKPHFVHLGPPQTLESWLDAPTKRSVEDLMQLEQLGTDRFRAVEAIIRAARAERAKEKA